MSVPLVHVFAYPWFLVGTVGAAVMAYAGYLLIGGPLFGGTAIGDQVLLVALIGVIGGLVLTLLGWTKAAKLAFDL